MEVGFCVLRDPVERAVSMFNMGNDRACKNKTASPAMHGKLKQMLTLGTINNLDLPQWPFVLLCDAVLCFNTLQLDWTALVTNASAGQRASIPPPGRPAGGRRHLMHGAWNGTVRSSAHSSSFSFLPHVKPFGKAGHCTTQHLQNDTRHLIWNTYHEDVLLFERHCVRQDAAARAAAGFQLAPGDHVIGSMDRLKHVWTSQALMRVRAPAQWSDQHHLKPE